jgi:Na+-translocating ferredoxin:NAD+ oxidoreductase RnfC subunit
MEGSWKLLNVGAFLTLGGFLGSLPVMSSSSGHLDAIYCYECRACAGTCPWGYDPAGYAVAARTNNPNKRMLAQIPIKKYNKFVHRIENPSDEEAKNNEQIMTLENLRKRDKYIKVRIIGITDPITVEKALEKGYSTEHVDSVYEMRAVDAAFYDPLCINCEPPCPVDLTITKWIRDLKDNGGFR